MPDEKYPRTVFDHEAFDYVGVKLNEPSTKPTWLGFYEKIGVVSWLYVVGFVWMRVIDVPFDRFGQLMIATTGIALVFIGMRIALRLNNYRPAVTYQERTRRRWRTIIASTIVIIVWSTLIYWTFTV